jgi:hypothetical protein
MWRALTAAAAVLLLPAAALAGYGGYGYGQPVMHVRAVLKDGRLVVRQFFLEPRTEKKIRTRQVEKDGKTETVTEEYLVTVMVPRPVLQTFDPALVRARDAAGRNVGAEALLDRLKQETPALMVYAGQDLDRRYRSILKKGTLILTVPRPGPATPPDGEPKKSPPEKIKPGKVEEVPTVWETGLPGKGEPKGEPPPDPGPKVAGPRGPQPTLAGASVDPRGVLSVRESSSMTTNQTLDLEVEKGGEVRKVPVRVKDTFMTMRVRALDVAGARASRADGRAVSPAALRQLLRKEVPVLVSADGRPVDPYYLEVIRGDTLVLVLPAPRFGPPVAVPVEGPGPVSGAKP